MPATSDRDHWFIDARVYGHRVEETHYVTDPARNIRKREQKKVWHVKKSLGSGGFGKVHLEESQEDRQLRAVKVIDIGDRELSKIECEREIEALLEFSKPRFKEAGVFTEFLGWFRYGSYMCLAMEFMRRGDLESNVTAQWGKLPEAEARTIIEQILSGLKIMHDQDFAHRDLKPQNVLVVHGPPNWWIKLADFGLSKKLTETTAYRSSTGTKPYMAPEMLHYLRRDTTGTAYTNAVDLWAVGCILYRLVTGHVPFPPGRSLMDYCDDDARFPGGSLIECGMSYLLFEFARKLLVTQPSGRPSASEALQDAWFTTRRRPDTSFGKPVELGRKTPEPLNFQSSGMLYNTTTHDGLKSGTHPSLRSSSTARPPRFDNGNKMKYQQAESFSASNEFEPHLAHTGARNRFGLVSIFALPPYDDMTGKESGETVVLYIGGMAMQVPSSGAVLSPNGGSVVATSDHGGVTLWKLAGYSKPYKTCPGSESAIFGSASILHRFEESAADVSDGAVSPNGQLVASGSWGGTVWLWYAATGKRARRLMVSSDVLRSLDSLSLFPMLCLTFSPNSRLLASRSAGKDIWVWDTTTGALLELKGRADLCSLAFSPDSWLLASVSMSGDVVLWNLSTGQAERTLKGHTTVATAAAFSSDNRLLATASCDMTVVLWDLSSDTIRHRLLGHTHMVGAVAFSPDCRTVASGSGDNNIRLWDTATGMSLRTLQGVSDVTALVFSSDGRLLQSAHADYTVRIWDLAIVSQIE